MTFLSARRCWKPCESTSAGKSLAPICSPVANASAARNNPRRCGMPVKKLLATQVSPSGSALIACGTASVGRIYAHGNKQGRMTLAATEFRRRSFCTCFPKASSASVTSGFSLIAFAPLAWGAMPTNAGLQLLDASRSQIQPSPFRQFLPLALSPLRCNDDRHSEIYSRGTINMYVLRFFIEAPSVTTLGCAPARRRPRVSALSRLPFSNLPFHPFTARPMITGDLSYFHPALPSRDLTPDAHSHPIGPRPPRQRLPPSLLVENASDPVFRPCHLSCPRRFRSRLATNRPSGLADTVAFLVPRPARSPRTRLLAPSTEEVHETQAMPTRDAVVEVISIMTRARRAAIAPSDPYQVSK